jgi:RNA polymerase sigma-70 factor (ECF subfamily)
VATASEAALEHKWIAKCLDGDTEAFGRLAEHHRGQVFRVAYGMLRNAEEAEDVTQEAFVKAFEALKRFDRKRPFLPWILSIATHLSIDRIRRAARARGLAEERPDAAALRPAGAEAADESLARRELREALWRAVRELDGRMRAVLWLRDIEGRPTEEVAEMLGIAPPTVRVHLFKARARVREHLGREGLKAKKEHET